MIKDILRIRERPPAVNSNSMPALDEPLGEFVGKCFKTAVTARNAARTENGNVHECKFVNRQGTHPAACKL
jgi:hypothetical protein